MLQGIFVTVLYHIMVDERFLGNSPAFNKSFIADKACLY